MTKVLYISYDGMTDALGQSQVIPYLTGLNKLGHKITVLSTEKRNVFNQKKSVIKKLFEENNIQWEYIFYTKFPPIFSTLKDIKNLTDKAFELFEKNEFDIIHCRSYISSLIGLKMKQKFGTKFLFDMRGFWADERVDGKIWNLKNPIYRFIYQFFKNKELQFLNVADTTISLTHNGKQEIEKIRGFNNNSNDIEVIPCCVDIEKFDYNKFTGETKSDIRDELKINKDTFVLSYLGSIGTWYMLEEMLDFYKVFLEQNTNTKFLFLTGESQEMILNCAKSKNIDLANFIIKKVDYSEVPKYLSISDYSIFFILPVFSKSASSPIKQGEIMSMGIPLICNSGVGDTDYVLNNYDCGFLIEEFNEAQYAKISDKVLKTSFDKNIIRQAAKDFYHLEKGIKKYHDTYNKILNL